MSAAFPQTLSPSAVSGRSEGALRRILSALGGLFKPRDPTLRALESMLDDPRLLKDIGLDETAVRRELESARARRGFSLL